MIVTRHRLLLHSIVIGVVFTLMPCLLKAGIPKSNYVVLDSLSRSAGTNLTTFLYKYSIDSCGLALSAHPAAWLLRQEFVSLDKVHFYEGNPNGQQRVDVQIEDCAVRYYLYNESADSLIREGQVITRGVLHKSGSLIDIPQFSSVIRDTIAKRDIAIVEIPAYPFTKSLVPEQPKGFFGEVAEPILFVAAAAVTVLLLFTVRSQ